jgi:hypothetical protein
MVVKISSHKETPCRPNLSKQKCLLSKMKNEKVKQVLSGDCYPLEEDIRKG